MAKILARIPCAAEAKAIHTQKPALSPFWRAFMLSAHTFGIGMAGITIFVWCGSAGYLQHSRHGLSFATSDTINGLYIVLVCFTIGPIVGWFCPSHPVAKIATASLALASVAMFMQIETWGFRSHSIGSTIILLGYFILIFWLLVETIVLGVVSFIFWTVVSTRMPCAGDRIRRAEKTDAG